MKFSVKVGRSTIQVNENLADRAVRYFNPTRAQRRMQARLQMEALSGGSYTGASKSRRSMSEWQTTANSADGDVLGDLPTLRDRSRDLVRNAPLATGAINTVVTNVIGTGLSLQSRIDRNALGMSEDQASEWQKNTEREFRMWCESQDCDITRTQNFYELQDLAFRSALESGDSFALLPHVQRFGDAYGLKIQLIEGDRVCNPTNSGRDTPGLAGGVEMDATGAPVAYHVCKTHPGDFRAKGREWDRIPAFGEKTGRRNVLHLFKRVRPGQNRGVPYLAPVIESLKQLDRYTEAEIMAAVVSGMFTVFVYSEGQGLDPANQMGMGAETGARASDKDIKMAPGAMIDLGPNEKIETANPGRPNTAFDPFVQAILRQVGVALELPFEILIKHFTASYSAARAAMLEAWKFFRVRRDWLAARFCQPIYETFLFEAVASGRIAAPGFFDDPLIRAAYCAAQWQGDGPGAIDPLKEVLAVEKRLEVGLTTLAKETSANDGSDWEDNHAQQVRERAMRLEGGLETAEPGTVTAPSVPDSTDSTNSTDSADKPENASEQQFPRVSEVGYEAYEHRIATLSASIAQLSATVADLQAQKPQSYVEQIERSANGEIARIIRTTAHGQMQIDDIERGANNEIIKIIRTAKEQ